MCSTVNSTYCHASGAWQYSQRPWARRWTRARSSAETLCRLGKRPVVAARAVPHEPVDQAEQLVQLLERQEFLLLRGVQRTLGLLLQEILDAVLYPGGRPEHRDALARLDAHGIIHRECLQ